MRRATCVGSASRAGNVDADWNHTERGLWVVNCPTGSFLRRSLAIVFREEEGGAVPRLAFASMKNYAVLRVGRVRTPGYYPKVASFGGVCLPPFLPPFLAPAFFEAFFAAF